MTVPRIPDPSTTGNRYVTLLARNPLVAAPLADVTDYPFRRVLRKYTDGLIHTEMVSVNSLVNDSAKTWRMVGTLDTETPPIGIQILASDELTAARSIRRIASLHPAVIDINMGCPVRKVLKADCGAALLSDPARAGRLVRAVKSETDLPIGVKMRLGVRDVTVEKVVEAVAEAGAEAATIHGRTAEQLYTGPADRAKVLDIARRAPIPIIVSGDVTTIEDIREILGCGGAGALVARGIMGRPWFLADALADLRGTRRTDTPKLSVAILEHLEFVLEYDGESGIRKFRRHLVEYVRGLPGAARLRRSLMTIRDSAELKRTIAEIDSN